MRGTQSPVEELQIAASQIGQFQRELQAQERLQTAQERIGTVEWDLQIAQERTSKVERGLQRATNEVERLTLERDFYSKRAST